MPLVPAVTELMVAELLYLEKQGATLPIEMLINSSGTTRQDGEILAFDSEGIALTSTMGFVKNPISTVNMGLAVGWACCVLSFGKKGWRKSLPHSLAMIQQPRVPPTGQRQAIEVHIKWREVLDYKREYLRMLSIGTGWPVEKLDQDMQRPLYMRPQEALEYGIIDEIIQPDPIKQAKAIRYWVKSGRAESTDRLQQWLEYIQLQEQEAMNNSFKKVLAQELRDSYRETRQKVYQHSEKMQEEMQALKDQLPEDMITSDDMVRLPFTKEGLKMAVLNAEQYGRRNVERRLKSKKVEVPEKWRRDLDKMPAKNDEELEVDYGALIRDLEGMDPASFHAMDLDELVKKYTRGAVANR